MPGLRGRLDFGVDSRSRLVLASPKLKTYRMVYRNVNPPYSIGVSAFTIGKRVMLVDFQHVIPAFRDVTIQHVWFAMESSNNAASIIVIDFSHLISPEVGVGINRGVINPRAFSSDAQNTSECKGVARLTTTTGLEDYVYSSTEFNIDVTGAVPTTQPSDLQWVDLLEKNYNLGPEEKLPFSPKTVGLTKAKSSNTLGTANDAWAIIADNAGANPVGFNFLAVIEFTEE